MTICYKATPTEKSHVRFHVTIAREISSEKSREISREIFQLKSVNIRTRRKRISNDYLSRWVT